MMITIYFFYEKENNEFYSKKLGENNNLDQFEIEIYHNAKLTYKEDRR